eukprot:3106256-Prymnesium_polylepis.1
MLEGCWRDVGGMLEGCWREGRWREGRWRAEETEGERGGRRHGVFEVRARATVGGTMLPPSPPVAPPP